MIAGGRGGGLFAIRVISIPIFIMILFLIFYALGGKAAQSAYKEEKINGFPSYPRARVWVKPGGGDSSAAMAKEWEKGVLPPSYEKQQRPLSLLSGWF